MRWLLSMAIICGVFLYTAFPAHAIIFLPALILIPIAKIVALIIGGFSIPAFGVGTAWSKLFKQSLRKTLFIIAIILLLIAVGIVAFLMIENPNRPLF